MIKTKIPKALREQVWLKHVGKKYEHKCLTTWCTNIISVFDFQSGHDVPESKGGPTSLENLYPICGRCNLSMSNTYTFKEWCQLSRPEPRWRKFLKWLRVLPKERSDTKVSGIKSSQKNTNQKSKPFILHGKQLKKKK